MSVSITMNSWPHRLFTLGLTAGLFLSGCATTPPSVIRDAGRAPAEFLLGPEDVLEVVVWRNPDLSREVVVRPDGLISLPLIGDVRASGSTTDHLARQIEGKLNSYVGTPRVSVNVKEVNSYYIYVLGEVKTPGKYSLKSYASVLQAIALAGGFTDYASKNDIHVVRRGNQENGQLKELRIRLRYDDLLSGNGAVGNFVLRTGDIVVVP